MFDVECYNVERDDFLDAMADKNKVSHRARAIEKLLEMLEAEDA